MPRLARLLLVALILLGLALETPADSAPVYAQNSISETYHLEPAGQRGGVTSAVAIQGNLAYIGVGPRLTILDISNPAQPVWLGETEPLPGIIGDIQIQANIAYVAAGKSGVRVVDIAEPGTPKEIGFYDTLDSAYDLDLAGNYLYVADGSEMLILDVSNPATPILIGSFSKMYSIYAVEVAGEYAYLASDYGGLLILDISNPAMPVHVGSVDIPGYSNDVAIQGNYAYVPAYGGLAIIDISNPSVPKLIGGCYSPESGQHVAIQGNYAYLGDWSSGLRIIDISNPFEPVEINFLNTEGYSGRVAVEGNYVYISDYSHGLLVVEIINSNEIGKVSRYRGYGYLESLRFAGDTAYIAERSGLRIVDLSNPAIPSEIGFFDSTGETFDVEISHNRAFLANGTSGLELVDITNPASQTRLGGFATPDPAMDIAVQGNYAFVAAKRAGLLVVDVSDPTKPNQVANVDTPDSAYGVTLAGGYAYVADMCAGLRIIRVEDPANPVEVRHFDNGYCEPWVEDVAISEVKPDGRRYAYLASYEDFLILDVTDPTHPVAKSILHLKKVTRNLKVRGNLAYLAMDTDGLGIVDISDPATPVLVADYDTIGKVRDTEPFGDYLYLADGSDGLLTLWMSPSISKTLPQGSGSLDSGFDQTQYTFPEGAFELPVTVTHTPHYSGNAPALGGLQGIGHFFEIGAVNRFGQPARPAKAYSLQVNYQDEELGGLDEWTLALYYWDGSHWRREPSSRVDVGANFVTARPNHFSLWAVLGGEQADPGDPGEPEGLDVFQLPYLVRDLNPSNLPSNPSNPVFYDGVLYFRATTEETGTELWKTDGTERGTVLVKDIYPGKGSSDPSYLVNLNGSLLFTARDGGIGQRLWRTDGTEAGTVKISDVQPGAFSSPWDEIKSWEIAGGQLYFSGLKGDPMFSNSELWKTDGTPERTVRVGGALYPQNFTT